jgi:D-alanine-D-alanine ligase-like ATP-grasp enzyme
MSRVVADHDQIDASAVLRVCALDYPPGYWFAGRQPVALVQIEGVPNRASQASLDLCDRLIEAVSEPGQRIVLSPALSAHALLSRLVRCSLMLLGHSAVLLPDEPIHALRIAMGGRPVWVVGVPVVKNAQISQGALIYSASILSRLLAEGHAGYGKAETAIRERRYQLANAAVSGVNTPYFLRAASETGIPWCHWARNVFQFGWGRSARLLDSSFTDMTSVIGGSLARDKEACNRVMAHAGLPAIDSARVYTEAQALDIANEWGYPVVLKPADLDGGRGVLVGLRSAQEVVEAYRQVVQLSSRVLIQRYVPGNDYRLQVFQGDVYWVVHRRPAHIVGDGCSTVRELVETENHRRSTDNHSTPPAVGEWAPYPLVLDDESTRWLAAQQLTHESVPAKGQYVRLRGAANVGQGGSLEPVLAQAHPDNLALAAAAVRVLRLDLAGVDLLIPDISRSWREGGAAICEVNAQPQLSPGLHAKLLQQMLPDSGRIPVIIVVGGATADRLAQALWRGVARTGCALVGCNAQGVDARQVQETLAQLQAKLLDPETAALIVRWHAIADLVIPWPVDKVDYLVFADDVPGLEGSVLRNVCQRAHEIRVCEPLDELGRRMATLKINHRRLSRQAILKEGGAILSS